VLQVLRAEEAPSLLAVVPNCFLPEDFQDVCYSSCLLLPVSLPDTIVNDPLYEEWCESGFGLYLEDALDALSFSVLKRFIMQEMFAVCSGDGSLVQHVGFAHGFLSALALVDRVLALRGLDCLLHLTDHFVFLSLAS
jgi:hypothetical protein